MYAVNQDFPGLADAFAEFNGPTSAPHSKDVACHPDEHFTDAGLAGRRWRVAQPVPVAALFYDHNVSARRPADIRRR